jgi:hypothetical protein
MKLALKFARGNVVLTNTERIKYSKKSLSDKLTVKD